MSLRALLIAVCVSTVFFAFPSASAAGCDPVTITDSEVDVGPVEVGEVDVDVFDPVTIPQQTVHTGRIDRERQVIVDDEPIPTPVGTFTPNEVAIQAIHHGGVGTTVGGGSVDPDGDGIHREGNPVGGTFQAPVPGVGEVGGCVPDLPPVEPGEILDELRTCSTTTNSAEALDVQRLVCPVNMM